MKVKRIWESVVCSNAVQILWEVCNKKILLQLWIVNRIENNFLAVVLKQVKIKWQIHKTCYTIMWFDFISICYLKILESKIFKFKNLKIRGNDQKRSQKRCGLKGYIFIKVLYSQQFQSQKTMSTNSKK